MQTGETFHQQNMEHFTVALDWIFFKSGGVRRGMIQFIIPDQDVTHTRFQVTGEYLTGAGKELFRVHAIYAEHDLGFLNGSSKTRLRDMLKAKIDARISDEAPGTHVPTLRLDIVSFGAIRDVSA